MAYTINDAFNLLKDRAGTRGISSNITPVKFNRWWNSAELKFFNTMYDEYSRKQTISDSISKWMSDPIILNIPASGNFIFPTNLLHVDSMSTFLPGAGTAIGSLNTLVGGNTYTNGTYTNQALTGGAGTGATATIIVAGNTVTSVTLTALGIGYAVNDILSATIPAGSGFTIKVATLVGTVAYKVKRVEKQRLAANLSSQYDAPSSEFPIYTQFSTSFQFNPLNLGVASMVMLQKPVWSVWTYTLQGYINTLTGLVGGSAYTNGTYTNVPLTGGAGTGALATVVVSGNAVTSVTITNQGTLYLTGDVLSALAANIGGTGTGFTITVSSLVQGSLRPVYDPVNSIQPLWNDDDISTIVDLALFDAGQASRDQEALSFAQNAAKSQQ
jgi:hypothetical protein